MKERTKRLGDATNPQNKKKEIAMNKRKSYAELEAVKEKNSVWSGFVIITLTQKERLQRLIILYHMFSKKK